MAPIDKIDALEDLKEIQIDLDHLDYVVKIRTYLGPKLQGQLIKFLKEHRKTFAWSNDDIIGVDPNVISHKLNVDPIYRPVRQKWRKFALARNKVINEEVEKLKKKGFRLRGSLPRLVRQRCDRMKREWEALGLH